MLSIIYSKWYYWGTLPIAMAYSTKKGASRNHPSTMAASTLYNTAWLIQHGCVAYLPKIW